MYCQCCQTRILPDEITTNGGRCPSCGTMPEWHSNIWNENHVDTEELEWAELED